MPRPDDTHSELDERLRVAERAHHAGTCEEGCIFCEREEDQREIDGFDSLRDDVDDELPDDGEEC